MEVLDTVAVWQVKVGDLIQFQAWDEDETYVELMRVDRIEDQGEEFSVHGESLRDGDALELCLDPFLEVEIMGA